MRHQLENENKNLIFLYRILLVAQCAHTAQTPIQTRNLNSSSLLRLPIVVDFPACILLILFIECLWSTEK